MVNRHTLKTWPEPFRAMEDGIKLFEYRKNDRNFQFGDVLIFHHWDPNAETYNGETIIADVVYIIYGGRFGIPEGYCIMGLGNMYHSVRISPIKPEVRLFDSL